MTEFDWRPPLWRIPPDSADARVGDGLAQRKKFETLRKNRRAGDHRYHYGIFGIFPAALGQRPWHACSTDGKPRREPEAHERATDGRRARGARGRPTEGEREGGMAGVLPSAAALLLAAAAAATPVVPPPGCGSLPTGRCFTNPRSTPPTRWGCPDYLPLHCLNSWIFHRKHVLFPGLAPLMLVTRELGVKAS